MVILVHPDTVKELLMTAEPKIVNEHSGYRRLVPWLGEFVRVDLVVQHRTFIETTAARFLV